MEDFLIRFGLIAVFFGAALEGDVSMILTGVVAHLHFISLSAGMVVGCLGAMVTDCVCYGLGRRRASTIRSSRVYRHVASVVEPLAQRLGPSEIVAARFVYGARIASMLLWGTLNLPFWRFVMFDVVGCALWALAFASLGYGFSSSAAMLIGRARRVERWLLGAALVAGVAALVTKRWVRRREIP